MFTTASRFASLAISSVAAGAGSTLEAFHRVVTSHTRVAGSVRAGEAGLAVAAVAHVAPRALATAGPLGRVLALRPPKAGRRVATARYFGRSWCAEITLLQ